MVKNQNEILINFLKDDAANQLNWAQKKETAVWLATVFYISIITTLINLKSIYEIDSHKVLFISILIFIFLLFISVCYFIYSNFSSIYNSNAYYLAIKSIIFNVLRYDYAINLDKTDPEIQVYPDILNIEIEKRKESISPKKYRGNPLKLLFRFWLNIFMLRSQNKHLGSNLMVQESAIYSILIIATLSFYVMALIFQWCRIF